MPGATPTRHYPYPLDLDPIDVAGDTQRLAEAIDADVNLLTAGAGALTTHLADQVDAHDASAISFVPTAEVPVSDVQTAIEQLGLAATGGVGSGLPPGGAAGTVLGKNSATNFDVGWLEPIPAGTIWMTIGTVADPGWLLLHGQTVADAQTLYPTLWTKAPIGWRSGTSLVFPDARRHLPAGFDAGSSPFNVLGSTASSNTRPIAEANLPSHSHGLNGHTHRVNGNTTDADAPHGHNIDHGHSVGSGGNGLTGLAGAHSHGWDEKNFFYNDPPSTGNGVAATGGDIRLIQWHHEGDHQHSVTVNTTSGLRAVNDNARHRHPVDITSEGPGTTTTTTPTGSGTPFDVTPAILVVNFQIKVH